MDQPSQPDLIPYRVTMRHPVLRGETSLSETINAVNPREAVYEFLEHHAETASWQDVDLQVRRLKSLADSASAA